MGGKKELNEGNRRERMGAKEKKGGTGREEWNVGRGGEGWCEKIGIGGRQVLKTHI
jgi:hypothetical protein